MKYTYSKTHNLPYYLTNSLGELSLDGLFNLHQEMLTEYFETFGMDNFTMKDKYNSAWVFTKMHADIIKNPVWDEDIKLNSEITFIKLAKVCILTTLSNKDDEVLAKIYCEACVIDLVNRKIVKLSDVSFPDMDVINDQPIFLTYEEKEDVKEIDRVIKYTDIDFTKHTNNVSYIRFIEDILGEEFFNTSFITTFDIHFRSETRIKDTLRINYSSSLNRYDFRIYEKDKVSTDIILTYKNR